MFECKPARTHKVKLLSVITLDYTCRTVAAATIGSTAYDTEGRYIGDFEYYQDAIVSLGRPLASMRKEGDDEGKYVPAGAVMA